MEYWKLHRSFLTILVILFGLAVFTGCDSGKKTIDDVTGNTAVKQYQKSEQDVKGITDKQSERLGTIPGDNDSEDEDKELDEE
jgi:uncharacterized lipoprotein YajG